MLTILLVMTGNGNMLLPVNFFGGDTIKTSSKAGDIVLCLFLCIPVVWLALLIGQSMGNGFPELLQNLLTSMQTPMEIVWTEDNLI